MSPQTKDPNFPHFVATPTSKQLIVDGKPYLILGAELQNSSLSCAEYMAPIWPRLQKMNINTVLGNVTWEQIEPEEGKFDFEIVERAIESARSHGMRLILLWFGSWKNGLSIYTPSWVKMNPKRFPRVELRMAGGQLTTADIVSLFHEETRNADTRAYVAFMQHLKDFDSKHKTVIIVQVQNEVGIIGDSRDASPAANAAFTSPVPSELTDFLSSDYDNLHLDLKANLTHFRTNFTPCSSPQSWKQTFGKSPQTDELFMAYNYALYLGHISASGRRVYPLPTFTNVWLNNSSSDRDPSLPAAAGGGFPGSYPSGGPLPNVIDIWQKFAPSLEFIGPDIYLADYEKICAKYRHRNQVLFIPEQRSDEFGARRAWMAIGSYGAVGIAPFGIDSVTEEKDAFTRHYRLLSQIRFHILKAHRKPGSSYGFFFDDLYADGRDPSPPITTSFGDWEVVISRAFVFGKKGSGAGMIIRLDDGKEEKRARFLLAGFGYQCKWRNTRTESVFTGLLSFTEMYGDVQTGELRRGRMLNGDESESGKLCIMPNEKPDNGDFPIPMCMPAGTMIAECEVYSLHAVNRFKATNK